MISGNRMPRVQAALKGWIALIAGPDTQTIPRAMPKAKMLGSMIPVSALPSRISSSRSILTPV